MGRRILQTIMDVYDALRRYVDVQGRIRQIQAHPWVRVLEENDKE